MTTMSETEVAVEALVTGGKATGGPPLGPALGPMGVNTGQVVAKINEETKDFAGLKVPVIVWVNKADRTFRIEVKTPQTSALIIQALGIEKGSGEPNENIVGDLDMEQVVQIAKKKWPDMTAVTLAKACKTVLGTCVSMGVTVDGGKDARIVQTMIDDGEYTDIMVEDE